MKLSIRAKITLISMAILLIAICLSTVVSGYIFINEYIKVLQNNANIIGQNLKMQLDRLLRLSIPINDLIGFEKQCSDMVEKYKEISYAMVVNREGRILFHNDPEIMDQSLKDSKTYEALLTEEESLYTTKYNNMNFYEIIIPVYDRNNAYAGIVGVGFPQSIIFQKINSVIISIVILTVILLIVSIILLILALTRWVNQPLASLVNVIQDISENKLLDTRVKIYSRDEFGHLGNAFNKMTEELQNTTVSKVYVDSIIQNMIDSLIVIGMDSRIKTVNNAVCELLQYTKEELIGQTNNLIFVDPSDAIEGKVLEDLLSKGKILNFETYLRSKNKDIIPVLSSIAIMKNENNKIIDIIFVATDITDRKKAEDDLRKIMIDLREARDALWGEMQLAKKIQTALIPENPTLEGYDIAANMTTAASVGGDYYDVITVDNLSWLVIGDASGHGVSAGLIMMMAQTAIHTILNQNPGISPKKLLSTINKTITQNIQKLGEFNYMTITVIACLEEDSFSCSGLHLPLLIYRSEIHQVEKIEAKGIWLGILPGNDDIFEIDSFKLHRNDSLLLYTDGIVEAQDKNNELFSIDRLAECLKNNATHSAKTIKNAILAELKDFVIDDDVSLLVLKKR